MRNLRYAIVIFLLALFSGCTLYKKPAVPALNAPDKFKLAIKVPNIKLKEKWWENFHDEKLNQLVELSLKNNSSYQIALKNIDIACSYVNQARSSLFPQMNMSFNTSRNKSPAAFFSGGGASAALNPATSSFGNIFNLQQLFASFNYQLDVWNQLGNGVNSAKANFSLSEADANIVKLGLVTSVVTTYFQITAMEDQIENLRAQKASADKIVKLASVQLRGGLINASTLDTNKNQLETINSNLASLEKQQQVLIYSLAYLLGEYPEYFSFTSEARFSKVGTLNLVPPGIPSQMIANRPDIQAAFYQVLSYGYLEKQSIANFLPTLNLTANYGYASNALSNLLSYANSYWNYGLYTAQFVFDYQTRMSIYQRSKLQYESAIITYRDTVKNAFKEVDSALVTYQKDNESYFAYQRQAINSKNLLELAESQYQAGLSDYSTYLATHLTYLQTNYNVTNQKLAVIGDIIQVYNSLGLGLNS